MIKPRLRNDVEIDLGYLIKHAVFRAIEDQRHPFKNCINCTKFDQKNEICNQYKARPPARVIAYGCPEHVDMYEVPF